MRGENTLDEALNDPELKFLWAGQQRHLFEHYGSVLIPVAGDIVSFFAYLSGDGCVATIQIIGSTYHTTRGIPVKESITLVFHPSSMTFDAHLKNKSETWNSSRQNIVFSRQILLNWVDRMGELE